MADDDTGSASKTEQLEVFLSVAADERPGVIVFGNENSVSAVRNYIGAVCYAGTNLGFDINIPVSEVLVAPPEQLRQFLERLDGYVQMRRIDALILSRKLPPSGFIALNATWRGKIDTYVTIIRAIVRGANLQPLLQESILAKLQAFTSEVERDRTRLEALSGVFVDLCTGVSLGATKLIPAVRVLERMVGALSRLGGVTSLPALPPPSDLGLIEPPEAEGDLPD